jgi:ribosomal protein S18 acetylase RimI-like enzyme
MVTSQVTVRPASLADAALLAELGARTFSDTFAADNTPEDMAAYLATAFGPKQQASELADEHCVFLIAEKDDVAIGYAMLRSHASPDCITGARPVELVRLYVSQESIGSGVGAKLMQACINEATVNGFDTLWLGVWENNHRAQKFYSKWNFQTVGTHVFPLGADVQTDYLMELSLS